MSETPEKTIENVLVLLGEDPKREGLIETPKRVVKSWKTLFGGYEMDPKTILSTSFSSETYDEMILLKDIELFSTCEHHMLPFYGRAHVAYIPKDRVVGLSKLARLVECFSRRLQIQEKLTEQIADALNDATECHGTAVLIEAKHMCMLARGIQKQNSTMVTSSLRGVFRDDQKVRSEFFNMVRGR